MAETARKKDTGEMVKAALASEKIAALPGPYRSMGERLHRTILDSAPSLRPTTWYGMPAYAKHGKVLFFFRADKKYMTFGLTQDVDLAPDPGAPHQLVPCAWWFTTLDETTEAHISAIVRKVAG